MKKSFLTIFSCVLFTAILHAQIPNPGFENWTSAGAYSNPVGWGTMNNTTAPDSVYTATKGTPGNPGVSYLKLTSRTDTSFGVVNGIAVSGVLDSITMLPKSGFPYTLRSASLTGKWQHMIYGSSQGSIQVTLTRWDTGTNSRVVVGAGNVTLTGMAMSWANFNIPITYADPGNPDTCIIFMKASGSMPTNNDYLWVDNLAFSGISSIEAPSSFLNSFSIYPNPCNQTINLDLNLKSSGTISVELDDITGRSVLFKNEGTLQGETKLTLDVSSLSKGTYFLSIIGEQTKEVKKIIID